jgi:hypothetical protein
LMRHKGDLFNHLLINIRICCNHQLK